MNVDGRQAAALFDGARAKVIQRLHFPDTLLVELLDEGPNWHRGQIGQVATRYFIPNVGAAKQRDL